MMPLWKRNLYILWVTQALSLIGFGFGVPFMSFYIRELGVTSDVDIKFYTGLLSMAPAVTMAMMAPLWGILSDKFGRKLMILRAMFSAVFVIGGMGLVQSVEALLALRAAQGLLTGTVTASSSFVAANTPKARLSYALGFISSSTFIGFSIGPAIGGVVAKFAGYRASFMIGACCMLVGGMIALLFLKENRDSYHRANPKMSTDNNNRRVVTPIIALFLLMLFLQRFTRSVFSPYMALFIESLNGPQNAEIYTGLISFSIGIATAISSLTLKRLGDKWSKPKLLSLLLALCLILGVIVSRGKTLLHFVISYTLLFLVLGGVEPLMTSFTAEATPSHVRGKLFGLQGTIGSLGWMASPLIGSYISIQYGYQALLLMIPLLISLSFSTSLYVNYRLKKRV